MRAQEQEDIKEWFDQVYRNKGLSYLRPVAAYDIFRSILQTPQGARHLDVACGPGQLLKAFKGEGLELFGIDISTEAVEQARLAVPGANLLEGNAEELPYEDDFFDSVTCIGSIERMIHRERALREQFRVTRKAGRLCYMVRNSENVTWKYLLKPLGLQNRKGHQDALNLDQWSNLFTSTGFQIEAIYPDHWPYLKVLKSISPYPIATGRIRRFPFDIRLAYEFIFSLRKP